MVAAKPLQSSRRQSLLNPKPTTALKPAVMAGVKAALMHDPTDAVAVTAGAVAEAAPMAALTRVQTYAQKAVKCVKAVPLKHAKHAPKAAALNAVNAALKAVKSAPQAKCVNPASPASRVNPVTRKLSQASQASQASQLNAIQAEMQHEKVAAKVAATSALAVNVVSVPSATAQSVPLLPPPCVTRPSKTLLWPTKPPWQPPCKVMQVNAKIARLKTPDATPAGAASATRVATTELATAKTATQMATAPTPPARTRLTPKQHSHTLPPSWMQTALQAKPYKTASRANPVNHASVAAVTATAVSDVSAMTALRTVKETASKLLKTKLIRQISRKPAFCMHSLLLILQQMRSKLPACLLHLYRHMYWHLHPL